MYRGDLQMCYCSILAIFLLFSLNSINQTGAIVTNTSSIRDEIVESLFANYQSHVHPGELTQNQTVVIVYISISAITSVDVRNMEYTVDLLLRQQWTDIRLAWELIPKFSQYQKNVVSPVFKEKIWLPDLFFRNGKAGRLHKMTCENLLIRIQPNGEVLYSQKITMRLACQMELHTFPMDTQECDMNIGSYGYTLNQLRFVWRDYDPVTLPKSLQISEFDPPKEVTPHDCSSLYKTSTGQYTCLNATFILSRQIGYWLASTYIPNILIMVVSWLNFWVSLEAIPARVNLSLLTLLGVITQSTSYASTLPRVSYIKAIDVWTIACITFNSGVLLEFAVASHVSRRRKVCEWHGEVRKMVRRELARWCTACEQQYNQRGPSASAAYLMTATGGGSRGLEKTAQYFNSATTAACAGVQTGSMTESPSQQSVCLTKSGLYALAASAEKGSSPSRSQSHGGATEQRHRFRSDAYDVTGASGVDITQLGLETTQKEALLPRGEKKKITPSPINTIDSYSRFLFPLCFLFFNSCYWLYYLVLVKHHI